MSNEHPTVKGQSAKGPSHNSKQGQGQTLLHAQNTAKAESEHAEKKPSNKSQPQLGSKKRQPKSRSKTDSVCKQPKQRPKKKNVVSQKEEEVVTEQDSEEEITDDFTENAVEEKTGKRHQRKKFCQSKRPLSQLCLFDSPLTIHNDRQRRKFTGFLSEQLLQSEEVCRKSDVGLNDSLHTLSTETPSCSLSNELTCRNELTPWHLCGHPMAHEALRVKSETRNAENSKLSSSSMHLRRLDTQCRDKLTFTPRKWSQPQLSCGKLYVKKGQQLFSGKKISTHIATEFGDSNKRGPPSPEAAYHPRGRTFPAYKRAPYLFPTQPLVKHSAASPHQQTGVVRVKSDLQPSLLYMKLLHIVKRSSFQHKSERSEACSATECHEQHQDSTSTLSLVHSHPAADPSRGQSEMLSPRNTIDENGSAGGLNNSTFQEDSENKEQHSTGKDANAVKEEFDQSKEPTNQSPDRHQSSSSPLFSSAKTSSATDKKDDSFCLTKTSDPSSDSRTCIGHEETGKRPSIRISSDRVLDNLETGFHDHEVKTDNCKRKSLSSVRNKTEEPLGPKNLATNISGTHNHSWGVSERMKLEAAAAVSLKPSLAINKHQEKSDTHVTKTTTSRSRKWQKRSQHGDGKETKRTLSEIFRQLREKGCLVNNCQKCSQQTSSMGKSKTHGDVHQTSSLHRTSKGQKQSLRDPSAGEGHQRRNGNKAKHRRVATSNAVCSKAVHRNKCTPGQQSHSFDETVWDHEFSVNESHFETNQQKIQSEIRSYLNMQKAIDSKRSLLITNSVTGFKGEKEKEWRSQHCLTTSNPKDGQDDCSDPQSSVEGLSLCKEERTERLQDITQVITSKRDNNLNQLNTAAQQNCSEEKAQDSQRSNVTEDSPLTITPLSSSVNVPPPPPNSPILQSTTQPVVTVKKKCTAYRFKEKCTRAEQPMHLAKIELHESLRLGCFVSGIESVKDASSSQSVKPRTPAVTKCPQKLDDYLLSRLLHAKARSYLDRSRAAAGDKPTRSSSRSLYHPCTTKYAKKSIKVLCAPVLLFAPTHKKTVESAKARQLTDTTSLSVLPLGKPPAQPSSTSSEEASETEAVTNTTDEETTPGLQKLVYDSTFPSKPGTYSTSRAISSIQPELTERCENDYQLLRTVKPAYGIKSKLRR